MTSLFVSVPVLYANVRCGFSRQITQVATASARLVVTRFRLVSGTCTKVVTYLIRLSARKYVRLLCTRMTRFSSFSKGRLLLSVICTCRRLDTSFLYPRTEMDLQA